MDFHHVPIESAWRQRFRLRFCWRWLVIPFLGFCIWGWFDVRQRGYIYPDNPWEHKTDFTVYTEAGAAFFDGRPPYEVSNPRGWTYIYPPLFALSMAPLHVLPPQDQVMVWFVVSLLFCWGCVYECGRTLQYIRAHDDHVAEHYSAWYPWLGIAAVFAATLPTMNCLQRGQVGILKLYFLVLGLRLVISGHARWMRMLGGAALSLSIVLKIIPVLPVSFLIFVQFVNWIKSRRTRAPGATGLVRSAADSSWGHTSLGLVLGLLLFFLIVPSMLIGWKANLQHLETWSGLMSSRADDGGEDPQSGNSRSVRNQSLQNAVYRLGNFISYKAGVGLDDKLADFFERPKEIFQRPEMLMDSPVAETILLGLRLAILAALGIAGIRLGLRGDVLSLTTALGLGCVTMLVVSPVARVHYFMLFAPAILYVPLWLDRKNHPRAAKIMAVAPMLLIDLHYIFLSYTGRVGLLGIGTTLWLLAAFFYVVRSDRKVSMPALPDFIPQNACPQAIKQAA